MNAVASSEFSGVDAEVRSESENVRPTGTEGIVVSAMLDVAPGDESMVVSGTAAAGEPLTPSTPSTQSAGPSKPAAPMRDGPTSTTDFKAMSDEELLAGIRAESELHFAELYNRYFQRIYSFVYTRMRNHAETEEVVQETFLAVFRSFDRYRGQSSLLSWIYGIAKNTANSSIRRSMSMTERIDLADDEDLMPRPSIDVGTPAEQLDLHRFQDQLSQRLECLADWQTEIFEMRHFENLSIPEISRRTTRSSDAVRSSLYRVKRLFFEAAEASQAGVVMIGDPL